MPVNNVHNKDNPMLKSLFTLVRGTANRAVDKTLDQNALLILDQQIRDCADAIGAARKALAVAIARDRRERDRIGKLEREIADLETRATAALGAGCDDLAREAAETIAALENEHDAATKAQSSFAGECQRLRGIVRSAEQRLRDLERGRRTATTNDAVLKLRDKGLAAGESYRNTLSEAEATLARVQSRQSELDQATSALEELDAETHPASVADKLADAGFGAPTRRTAADVLARLKAKSAGDPPKRKKKPGKTNTA